jgi:nucleotide-binding universal stress UspA family protein
MHDIETMSGAGLSFRTILVPFDFSSASQSALDVAVALAATSGSAVMLVSVVEPPLYPDVAYSNIPAAIEEERRERHERLARLIDGRPGLHAVVREGSAKEAIVRCARDEAADLIVIGLHTEHGLDHWLRGSVVEHVVLTAPCHVLVVKPARGGSAERAA